jgi:hypothetical protein
MEYQNRCDRRDNELRLSAKLLGELTVQVTIHPESSEPADGDSGFYA